MNSAAAAQTNLNEKDGRTVSSKRLTFWLSVIWAVSLLLGSRFLISWLEAIRGFEEVSDFRAHNRIHWFRPIAFFWFHQFSFWPSIGLTVLILLRQLVPHGRRLITWGLALFTVSLLAIGAYTVWEALAFMHQFTH
jgi:hypothetical protein